MGMPVSTTIIGTGSFIFTPSWAMAPFQVGIAAVTNTSGINGTAIVDVSFQNINPQDAVGVAVASATWFTIIAATAANATANFTTPVQAIRASVVTATATSSWTINFVQAGLNY